MIHKALRRANRSLLFIVVSGLLFVAGFAGSTYAYFDGSVTQTGTYAGGTVALPASPFLTATGYDALVTWSPPPAITTTYTTPTTTYSATTVPGVQGQRIVAANNGTTANCTGVTYTTTVVSGLPKTQSTYTDSNRVSGASGNGDQFCYAVQTYWTTNSWYAQTTVQAQLGLALRSVAIANNNGTLANNDTITMTFNQPPATPSSVTVCTFQGTGTTGVVFIGDPTCSNKTTDAYQVAKITNVAVGGGAGSHQSRTATVSIAGNVMTVRVTQNGQTVSGTWAWTSSTNLKSAATTDQATICTAANSNCTPTHSGGF